MAERAMTATVQRAAPAGEAERPAPALRHVATIAHAHPGEALITCTCRGLRTAVDVDDPLIARFILWEHLHRHVQEDHLLVDDARTGVLYALTGDAEPEIHLTLTPRPKGSAR